MYDWLLAEKKQAASQGIEGWAESEVVLDWLLAKKIKPHHKVLEIGPGRGPWDRADVFIDFDVKFMPKGKGIKADLAEDLIPFPNKTFDFVYCRHTLEDMFNPFHACREMSRVGKAGYIETPSPAAELAKGVDAIPIRARGIVAIIITAILSGQKATRCIFCPNIP